MSRFWSIFRSRRLDRELDAEIAEHLALQEEEFRRAGMSPEEARLAARREFGGVARTQEIYRERRGLPRLEAAAKDFRYALRGLRQNKAFAAAAVLSLALGIGANTAVFTIFRALMLRSLPVTRPEELVTLHRTGAWQPGYSSYPLYLQVRKRSDLFQDVVARSAVDKVRLRGQGDRIETIEREHVTGNFFRVLGVQAAIGRLIGDADDRTPHAHPIAVLTYDYWQGHFGGDAAVLGRTIVVDGLPLTIVGVAQRGFRGVDVDHRPDVWLPVMMGGDGDIMEPGLHWLSIIGRRRPEVARPQIQAAIDVLLHQFLDRAYGQPLPASFKKRVMAQQIEVREGDIGISSLRDRFGTSLNVLMAAVGLVLLAACANVANLLLARGAARGKEVALRVSLGATRGRLIQQALMESFLLAALGAVFGVAVAYWGTSAILTFLPEPFAVSPDAAVLGFTVAISAAAAMLVGLGPALRSAAIDPAAALRMGSGSGGSRPTTRRALVTAQVAFSVVLVALAGLFGHSMAQLRRVNLGFVNENLVGVRLNLPSTLDLKQKGARREELIRRMQGLPGVSAVSYAFPGPFLSGNSHSTVRVVGSGDNTRNDSWTAVQTVGPRYFEMIGATLAAGRGIERTDTPTTTPVAVVNEAFVRERLPDEPRPLGRAVTAATEKPLTIVGIVRDIAHDGLRAKAAPTVYLAGAQHETDWEPTIVARASGNPAPLLAALRREAAGLGLMFQDEPKTVGQRIDESVFQDRLLATIGAFFGFVALALAAVGLYGVVAYGVARRAREIGIRIALGARRGEVLRMMLGDALLLVAAGLFLGLPASYAAAVQVRALLFGVKPLDPAAFALTAAVLGAVGLAAALFPARRAASLEPLSVLRQD